MGNLMAGAAKTNITPPLGVRLSGSYVPRMAEEVIDQLHAKAIVFSDGQTSLAVVVCDLIAMTRVRMDAVKQRAEAMSGVPASNILIACTHTHSGPAPCWVLAVGPEEEYMDWACQKIADAVTLASRSMLEAKVGTATGSIPDQVFNRRWRMKDGTVRMNPGYQNPDLVEVAGPTDPEFAVLAVETPQRDPIALLANYALHYVGSGASNAISADYFGLFGEAVPRMMGRDVLAVMSNGCSGDINNHDYAGARHPLYDIPRAKTHQVAEICAAEATRLWREKTEMSSDVILAAASREVQVEKRHIPDEELVAARKAVAAGGDLRDAGFHWQWQKVRVSELPDTFPTLLQALRIGNVGLVGLPGEIFVDIGLQIKAGSPFEITMPIELANGYLGYTCTDRGLQDGGYETWTATSSLPEAGTERLYVDTSTELLDELFALGERPGHCE